MSEHNPLLEVRDQAVEFVMGSQAQRLWVEYSTSRLRILPAWPGGRVMVPESSGRDSPCQSPGPFQSGCLRRI